MSIHGYVNTICKHARPTCAYVCVLGGVDFEI